MKKGQCYHCGNALAEADYGRQESCSKCGRSTRVCRNCRHYDRSHNNECREEQAGRIVEKEKANFCEWFQVNSGSVNSNAPSKDQLKSAADALFKKK